MVRASESWTSLVPSHASTAPLNSRLRWVAAISCGVTQPYPAHGGASGPQDQANYTNIVSNRLYGPLFGLGSDVYVGHGFGINLDLRCGSYIDVVKERAKYELGDHSTAAQRSRTDYTMAFELAGRLNLTWYPIEGVELRFGYELQNLFNTVSSPRPIDFNMGSITPTYDKGTYRFFDGFAAGISLIF